VRTLLQAGQAHLGLAEPDRDLPVRLPRVSPRMGATGRQAPQGILRDVRFARLPTWANLGLTHMRRSSTLRTRIRVGQASRRRIRAGGPLALGRPAATLEAW